MWTRTPAVVRLCLTLCNLMNCSTPAFPVLHHLPEFTQTPVHWGQEENGVTEDENSPAITKLYNLILQVGEPQPGEQTDLQKARCQPVQNKGTGLPDSSTSVPSLRHLAFCTADWLGPSCTSGIITEEVAPRINWDGLFRYLEPQSQTLATPSSDFVSGERTLANVVENLGSCPSDCGLWDLRCLKQSGFSVSGFQLLKCKVFFNVSSPPSGQSTNSFPRAPVWLRDVPPLWHHPFGTLSLSLKLWPQIQPCWLVSTAYPFSQWNHIQLLTDLTSLSLHTPRPSSGPPDSFST